MQRHLDRGLRYDGTFVSLPGWDDFSVSFQVIPFGKITPLEPTGTKLCGDELGDQTPLHGTG